MNPLLQGKIAIVTGGNAGIGKAIATTFAKEGAHVIIFATHEERGLKTIEEIRSAGGKADFFKVNVAITAEVDLVIQQVLLQFSTVDILVNNAGIVKDTLLMKMSEEDWDSVLSINLKSVYNTCHALARAFLKARKGKIINITSVVGLTGNAGQANYAASKSGMIGFTKSLAKELGSRGICANCIAPGFIDTNMTKSLNDDQKKAIFSQIPMGRLGKSEEIADAALFLASDLANYITGQVLTVDGGMVM